ncbi:hypothetical protein EV679_1031 [Kerstersia gyiorum]|jgi:hypothetical protein|uniref:Uncharacterized protein n=1 Tax=Kerstersia gyiorum TaxID=206506 RepID=A0A171KVP2_9BURK|nr:hypothetical protein AAV32_01100 [Kerstersia gyiorum]MCP1632555.1 hypothetical protein [Kerstersia gyiorum]MCP1634939.1 hypothetical protein [Kerstersia gyiorum]MCP1670133.1 hypothetical protein [Kerstersia gyiorum]MCP1678274.1 hypothetical protein [Kerstersia gyiorum]
MRLRLHDRERKESVPTHARRQVLLLNGDRNAPAADAGAFFLLGVWGGYHVCAGLLDGPARPLSALQ